MTSNALTSEQVAKQLNCNKAQFSKLIHHNVKGAPRLKAAHLGRRPGAGR